MRGQRLKPRKEYLLFDLQNWRLEVKAAIKRTGVFGDTGSDEEKEKSHNGKGKNEETVTMKIGPSTPEPAEGLDTAGNPLEGTPRHRKDVVAQLQ